MWVTLENLANLDAFEGQEKGGIIPSIDQQAIAWMII